MREATPDHRVSRDISYLVREATLDHGVSREFTYVREATHNHRVSREISYLMREATHDHGVSREFTHVHGAEFPDLSGDAVLLHQRLLCKKNKHKIYGLERHNGERIFKKNDRDTSPKK